MKKIQSFWFVQKTLQKRFKKEMNDFHYQSFSHCFSVDCMLVSQ